MDSESLSFEWKLENYCHLPNTAKSPQFELCGNTLQLRLKPHGTRPFVDLHLQTLTGQAPGRDVRPLRVSFGVTISSPGLVSPFREELFTMFFADTGFSTCISLPLENTVEKSGNTLLISVEMKGTMQMKDGEVGEFTITKRKREDDTGTVEPQARRQRLLADDSAFLCTLCSELQRDSVFRPCNHMGCCFTCASKLEHKRCPFCNEEFDNVEQVYLP